MEILLRAKEVIDLNKLPSHFSVKCLFGNLWVTCKGDPNDYILKPGKRYSSSGLGKVVIMALTEVRLCIDDPLVQEQKAPLGTLLHA